MSIRHKLAQLKAWFFFVRVQTKIKIIFYLNPFHTTGPFLYDLKTWKTSNFLFSGDKQRDQAAIDKVSTLRKAKY